MMKVKISLALFVCLFFVAAANAQVFLKVSESETKAIFENNNLQTNLAVENTAAALTANVKLEILDADDKVLAISETSQKIGRGKQNLPISVNFIQKAEVDDLLWKRLRYTLTAENFSLSNIVSLSEIMPEVFELLISAPEEIFAGMTFRAHVVALHPFTKKPVKNVEISGLLELDTEADENELILKTESKTNAEGFVSLDFKIPSGAKLDDGEIKIKGIKKGIFREADQSLDTSPEAFVYFNTDKPIYQPAQKLFVRGLYLDRQKRPVSDRDLDFEITNETGDTVYQGTAKTSRFGVINIEWQIPSDAKLGSYEIEIENDDSNDIGRIEFKVSRYDLPNFSVSAKSDKLFYLPNELSATVTVSAAYLFGKQVERGKIRIVREKERTWSAEAQKYEVEEGEKIEGETDAEGKFTTQIDLSEAQKELSEDDWKRFKDAQFVAYFTDPTTNRTEQKRFDIRLTKEPIHVYFIRQSADPNPKLPFLFYVSTFYADGTPVKCDVKIEGNYKNTTLQTKLAEAETNSYGAGKFEIVFPEKPFPEAENEFNFRIFADDGKGNRGILEDNLYISKGAEQIRVRTDKTIYLPNQPINLQILSSANEQAIFVNLMKNSNVIYSKFVKLKNGKENLTIPFRSDFSGELTILAFARGDEYYETIKASKAILFPNAARLDLNVKSLKTSYRPNEEAKISINAQNGENGAAETALGVLVLDKAIEERAAVEQLPDNFASIRKLLGTSEVFGNLTRRDLENLDLSKPVSSDLQLAAEFLLVPKDFRPNFFESDSYQEDFSRIYKDYFDKKFKKLADIFKETHEKTGDYPKDKADVSRILAANGVNFDDMRDAWNSPLQIQFFADRAEVILSLKTAGADKKISTEDDFTVREIRFEWFRKTQNELTTIINNYTQNAKEMPQTAEELKAVWKNGGADFDALRDNWNRPFYLERTQFMRNFQKVGQETVGNLDGENQQVTRTKTVSQKVLVFKVKSKGADGIKGYYDDFEVGSFTIVLEETDISDEKSKTEISKTRSSNSKGAIGGTIFDPAEAVIPAATITAINMSSNEDFSTTSDENGEFLLFNLPSGKYKITASSPGFNVYSISNVVVSSMNFVKIKITLEVGMVTSTVDVSSDVSTIDMSDTQISNNVKKSETKSIAGFFENNKDAPNFTPRVREYFPETLVWIPEIVTDKNGKTEVKFKLGDNLTTWKLYAVGSTENGEIGLVEKEFQTFQPFFAELDPPRILTEGDEIALAVPIRNYTDKRRKVSVSMANNDWSKILSGTAQTIEIPANSSQNAIFNFQAATAVIDGKQRVTALANKEGDAIEKPVTVRPNGREVVETATDLLQNEIAFNVNFPANALPNNRQTELKIYPNMLTHVAESVEGLLKRPYGCGEQTTSSTYPNLLILKIEKDLGKPIDAKLKSQAQTFLQEGYKRLLTYQTDTGFGYWSGNAPDIALTAYVLRFLEDAKDFIEVDEMVVEKAEKWLLSQQKADGSWNTNRGSSDVSTAYVLRSLSLTAEKDDAKKRALESGIRFFKGRIDVINDAFVLANIALVSHETDNTELERQAIEKLENLVQSDKQFMQYWTTSNTPFYGSGTTANIETTALVIQAFSKYNPPQPDLRFQSLIGRGLNYLLKNKDRYGVWYSTQTTVNVLDALILLQKTRKGSDKNQAVQIYVNGAKIQELSFATDAFNKPFVFDVSAFLSATNRIEIKGLDNLTMAQIVSKYYVGWNEFSTDSRYFDFKIDFNKTEAKIGEEMFCRVKLQRKINRYGMILAEIGLPPGADVLRESLEKAKRENKFSSYDVLPDKVVIYAWASDSTIDFNFAFRPRFGLNAQSAPSIVYDYYNEEASATVAPLRFEVK